MVATASTLSKEPDAVTQALPLLCRLQSLLPGYTDLKLIAAGTQGSLPLGYDGYLTLPAFSEWSVASLIPTATKRWSLRLQPLPTLSPTSILRDESLSDSGVDIITHLLYRQRSSRSAVAEWLASPESTNCGTTHLVRILFAFYDAGHEQEDFSLPAHFLRIAKVVSEARHPREVCTMAASCAVEMVASSPSSRTKYFKILTKELPSVAPEKLSVHSLRVARDLLEQASSDASALAEQLLDLGLKWAVRYIADDSSTIAGGAEMLSTIGSSQAS